MAVLSPNAAIRRFDVFAEYTRQQAIEEGMPPDAAKGYGLWLAKVVAARRFGHTRRSQPPIQRPARATHEPEEEAAPERSPWRVLAGESQTDALFDQEIVQRMGRAFYQRVFIPAIREAIRKGEPYRVFRDTVRREWKP
jgi:hypothetical protein